MTEEKKLAVVDMIRLTGRNTAEFMEKVAAHIEGLEQEVLRLRERVDQLESQNGNNSSN